MAGANAQNLWIAAFREAAMPAFQSGSKLRSRVTRYTGIEAQTYRCPVIGRTDAEVRASQADVTPSNIDNAKPTAVLTPREAFEYLDKQDAALTNVDLARAYGKALGLAVARQFDADIIASLQTYDANAYSRPGLTANLEVSTTTAGQISADDLAEAYSLLLNEEVGVENPDDCTVVFPALQFQHLVGEQKFTSADYGPGSATQTAMFAQMYNCQPVFIGQGPRTAGKGRLPDNKAYMFARSAVALVEGTTENMAVMDWVTQKRSWLVGAEANAGSTRTQNAGLVEITIT